MRPLPLLRALRRPLAVLAAWLVVLGTALPFAAAGDGPLCLAAADGLPATHCNACLAVAVIAPDPPAPPSFDARRTAVAAPVLAAVTEAAARTVWIRGPPAG